MVRWQEVGRVISAVHHHGPHGLRISEIQKLVRKQPNSGFNFKEALEEAVRTGFLRVRNHRFYPCNWQELVSKRNRGHRLPRGMQTMSSDSCTGVQTARRRRSSRSGRRRGRGRMRSASRRRSPPAYARRRTIKSRSGASSSYASRRRRGSQRPRRRVRKVTRSRRRRQARAYRRARVGSDEKLAPDGHNGVTPAEHATGKKYPPR